MTASGRGRPARAIAADPGRRARPAGEGGDPGGADRRPAGGVLRRHAAAAADRAPSRDRAAAGVHGRADGRAPGRRAGAAARPAARAGARTGAFGAGGDARSGGGAAAGRQADDDEGRKRGGDGTDRPGAGRSAASLHPASRGFGAAGMIRAFVHRDGRLEAADPSAPEGALWIDLVSPTEAEAEAVSAALGVPLPRQAEMEEIEPSSRLYHGEAGPVMTALLPADADADAPVMAPASFVLGADRLVTLRLNDPRAFRTYPDHAGQMPAGCAGPEAVIDRLADVLERLRGGVPAQPLQHVGWPTCWSGWAGTSPRSRRPSSRRRRPPPPRRATSAGCCRRSGARGTWSPTCATRCCRWSGCWAFSPRRWRRAGRGGSCAGRSRRWRATSRR